MSPAQTSSILSRLTEDASQSHSDSRLRAGVRAVVVKKRKQDVTTVCCDMLHLYRMQMLCAVYAASERCSSFTHSLVAYAAQEFSRKGDVRSSSTTNDVQHPVLRRSLARLSPAQGHSEQCRGMRLFIAH
jgi:hypothetical protein